LPLRFREDIVLFPKLNAILNPSRKIKDDRLQVTHLLERVTSADAPDARFLAAHASERDIWRDAIDDRRLVAEMAAKFRRPLAAAEKDGALLEAVLNVAGPE
jgi:hypothetical protein